MDKVTLRKVQLEQLCIAKEIKRVCDENGIQYFLDAGTLLGAVRHHGFIPWDDDLDIGMKRDEYERFCKIAPKALHKEFYWQEWRNDKEYALPFGKVRKRNTIYIEERSHILTENGFYVDVFPYDYAPTDENKRKTLTNKRIFWARCMLMKHGYQPWLSDGKINIFKRLGYLPYQAIACFLPHQSILKNYENLVLSIDKNDLIYEQFGAKPVFYFRREWYANKKFIMFEDEEFAVPEEFDKILTTKYGDYMKLPPKDKRENRHNIVKVKFSNDIQ